MNRVVIGVGSNIDKYHNVEKARKIISEKFKLIRSSQFKETKPIGPITQEDFLNGAWLIETDVDQKQLKQELHRIEDLLLRDRNSPKQGPRTIDLDLVVWNGEIVDSDYFERDYLKQCVDELLNPHPPSPSPF